MGHRDGDPRAPPLRAASCYDGGMAHLRVSWALAVIGASACGFNGVPEPDAAIVPPTLNISPPAASFGAVAIGSASTAIAFTITNSGSAPTSTAAIDTSLSGAAFAVLADTCAGTALAAGDAPCTITVAFLPSAAGPASEALGVSASPGGSATVALTGIGVSAADATASAMSLAFGNVISGEASVMTLAVANPAGAGPTAPIIVPPPAPPFSVLVGAVGSGNDCGSGVTSLAGGQMCNIRVQYAPTGTTHAAQAGTLLILQDAQVASVALTGTQVTPISVSPATSAFGNIDQGASPTTDITVTNNSVNPVTITSAVLSGATGMAIAGTTCTAPLATAATCTVTVQFAPTSVVTDTAAKLQVNSANGFATATLTGHGNAPATVAFTESFVAPNRFDFGSTQANTTGASRTFTLVNLGETASAVVTPSISNATDFTLTGSTCGIALAGGATCAVTVQFKPPGSSTGARTASLTATGASNQIDVSGLSLGANSLVLTAPNQAVVATDFGAILVGTPAATQTFTLKNTGGGPQPIAASFDDPEYAITGGTCGGTLGGNASCTIIATFTPVVRGTRPATLQVTGAGNPYAQVTGIGQSPAAIPFPPASVVGCALVGGTCTFPPTGDAGTATATITLTNAGDVATGAITTSALAGTAPTQFLLGNACTTLAPGATCKLTASFKPIAGTLGVQTATFTLSAAPGLASQTVTLAGIAVAPATLAITPSDPQLAPAAVAGALDPTGTLFTITNTGGVPTGNLALAIGSDATNFKLAANTCPIGGPLAAGVSCTVRVMFQPQIVATGLTTTLTATGSPGGTISNTVTGDGQSALSAPSPVDLGAVAVGQASAASSVVFTNNADVTSGVLDVQLAGSPAMSIVADGCAAMMLAPHGSCTVSVRFVPLAAGAQTATLTAQAPGGTAIVALSGTGQ